MSKCLVSRSEDSLVFFTPSLFSLSTYHTIPKLKHLSRGNPVYPGGQAHNGL